MAARFWRSARRSSLGRSGDGRLGADDGCGIVVVKKAGHRENADFAPDALGGENSRTSRRWAVMKPSRAPSLRNATIRIVRLPALIVARLCRVSAARASAIWT
jgi:hypothetical protein